MQRCPGRSARSPCTRRGRTRATLHSTCNFSCGTFPWQRTRSRATRFWCTARSTRKTFRNSACSPGRGSRWCRGRGSRTAGRQTTTAIGFITDQDIPELATIPGPVRAPVGGRQPGLAGRSWSDRASFACASWAPALAAPARRCHPQTVQAVCIVYSISFVSNTTNWVKHHLFDASVDLPAALAGNQRRHPTAIAVKQRVRLEQQAVLQRRPRRSRSRRSATGRCQQRGVGTARWCGRCARMIVAGGGSQAPAVWAAWVGGRGGKQGLGGLMRFDLVPTCRWCVLPPILPPTSNPPCFRQPYTRHRRQNHEDSVASAASASCARRSSACTN